MSYYKCFGQMDLTDRLAIETGLCRGDSFKRIAMRSLFGLLKMDLIPPDEVHLTPDLFKKNR